VSSFPDFVTVTYHGEAEEPHQCVSSQPGSRFSILFRVTCFARQRLALLPRTFITFCSLVVMLTCSGSRSNSETPGN
jgi:hypothetical protein